MTIKYPDADQQAALNLYIERKGKNWKQQLLDDWRTGADVEALPDYRGSYLRQIRNQFGPSWLNTYKN